MVTAMPSAMVRSVEPRLLEAHAPVVPWWVLHTRARNEKAVARALDNEGIFTYLPVVVVRHTYAKRKVAFEVPLFPGYVFMQGTPLERTRALRTNRVAHVIQVEDQARLERELAQIRRAIESGASLNIYPSLHVGQRCRVASGSMAGIEGTILRHGNLTQIVLSVTILGQSALLELDGALLETVAA
jgi:transcription antitermination factor NusG